MQIIRTCEEMKHFRNQLFLKNRKVALVPTMGCLHEGHASLVVSAQKQAQDVIVTIFVNPLQFGPNEDFQNYPRTLQEDLELLEKLGAAAVFCPNPDEIYGSRITTTLDGGVQMQLLCGESRPEHFRGVLTVVNILFNLTKPHLAFFGEKDYQQLFLIQKMNRDLKMDSEIVPCPIVREPDGLALSSRNRYFSREARFIAPRFYQSLKMAQDFFEKGISDGSLIKTQMASFLENGPKSFRIDYLSFVDKDTLEPCSQITAGKTRLLGAVYLENAPKNPVRLIDNVAF